MSLYLQAMAVAVCAAGLAAQSPELAEPFALKAGDEVINVDIGHAAPALCDWDGDGLDDLLVGQFGDGKLRIYRNVGTAEAPRYGDFRWFRAGGMTGRIPAS